jgi:phage-related protein
MDEKDLVFVGSSRDDIKDFPDGARQRAGFELYAVQLGEAPTDIKRMKSIGSGVYEIRIRDDKRAFRVVYIAKFEEAIYVLHAFEKKGLKTSKKDIGIARNRLKGLIATRLAK